MYGKQTESAIAALSRLAEVYDGGATRLSAFEIADSRGLQRPFTAKLLTMLSQSGLVKGNTGPGGGYTLARHPSTIRLAEVAALFERPNDSSICPFGGGICGVGQPCAVHNKLVAIQAAVDDLLHNTTLDTFRIAYQDDGLRPTPEELADAALARESYRAPKTRGVRRHPSE